jgi:hypothetical protein
VEILPVEKECVREQAIPLTEAVHEGGIPQNDM